MNVTFTGQVAALLKGHVKALLKGQALYTVGVQDKQSPSQRTSEHLIHQDKHCICL